MKPRLRRTTLHVILFLTCIGCHKKTFLKYPELLKSGKYFQKEYKKAGVDFGRYKFVYVKPINMDFIEENSAIKSDYLMEDLEQLKRSLLHSIKSALWKKYIPVSKVRSKKNTMVVHTAITKMQSLQDGNPEDSHDPISRLLGLRESQTRIEIMFFDAQTGDLIAEIYDYKIVPEKRSRPAISDTWESTRKTFAEWGIKLKKFME